MTSRLENWKRSARVFAGHWRFRAHQALANHAVPVYRRVRSIDTPLADRYLFVLAHPRSGSTVVSHVLQTNPDIVGFGEHHVGYDTESDLVGLATRNAWFDRAPDTTTPYTMDKIVWNHHGLGDPVVRHPDTRFVFLVREPRATLESYRRMFDDMPTDERRLESYEKRLLGLIDIAERVDDPSRCALVTYQDLIERTSDVLAWLSSWLELSTPLTPDYELNRKSGSQSWGDPSEHIKAGKIITVQRDLGEIDPEVLERAHAVHRDACERLRQLTTTVGRPEPAPAPESR